MINCDNKYHGIGWRWWWRWWRRRRRTCENARTVHTRRSWRRCSARLGTIWSKKCQVAIFHLSRKQIMTLSFYSFIDTNFSDYLYTYTFHTTHIHYTLPLHTTSTTNLYTLPPKTTSYTTSTHYSCIWRYADPFMKKIPGLIPMYRWVKCTCA